MIQKIIFAAIFGTLFLSCGSSRSFNQQKYTKLKKIKTQTEEFITLENENHSEAIAYEQANDFENIKNVEYDQIIIEDIVINTVDDTRQPQNSLESFEETDQIALNETNAQPEKIIIYEADKIKTSQATETKIESEVDLPEKIGKLTRTGTLILYMFIAFLIASGGVAIVLVTSWSWVLLLAILGFILFLIGVILMSRFFIRAVKNNHLLKKSEKDKPRIGSKLAIGLGWFLMILMALAAIPTLIVFGEGIGV